VRRRKRLTHAVAILLRVVIHARSAIVSNVVAAVAGTCVVNTLPIAMAGCSWLAVLKRKRDRTREEGGER